MISKIKKYCLKNKIPIIEDETLNFLVNFVMENQISNILEIGSAVGYSAISMANISNNLKITTIEKDLERYQLAKENIKLCNLDKQINLYNQDGLQFKTNLKFDMIFLDGPKAQHLKMIDNYYNNLIDEGSIIIDNMIFKGLIFQEDNNRSKNLKQLLFKIKEFRKEIVNDKRFNTFFYNDIGDGIVVLKKLKGV